MFLLLVCTIFILGTTSHGMPNENDKIIKILHHILTNNHVNLQNIFQVSVGSISNELFQAGIITHDVQQSPKYDPIINQFVSGMKIRRKQRDLEEYCKKFITALTNVGGPVKDAALMIQQDWIDIVKRELGIELQLN